MPSPSEQQREIAIEQSFVDTVYERLSESTKVAQSLVAEGMARGHIGHEGGLVERDAMVYQASRRLSALNAAHDGLVFGRLNLVNRDSLYIGRIGVRDENRDVILVDWRAPAAAVFYQATAQDPLGVVRRRVLRCSADQVIGVEDDLLDADNAPEDLVIIGEGALLASLTRARDSSMHSVVATIQKEQDEAIRAPARGATIIGGGPGTGKTVVALHRAAFLLYNDRRRFEGGGVLVVGPSSVFMSYIERVLPSLGETSVTLRSIGDVVDGLRAPDHDHPASASIKGSARMLEVLRRTASRPGPQAPTEFRYFYRDDVLKLDATELSRLRKTLLSQGTRNAVYPRVPGLLVDALWTQVRGDRALDKGEEAFVETISTDDRFVDFVEAWWPPVDAIELWRGIPSRLQELAVGVLKRHEIESLTRLWRTDKLTIEDIPLIDELRYLIGEVPPEADADGDLPKQLMSFERREREDREERLRSTSSIDDDGFAHILVDEAQDLSPMQWRMLGRRGRTASWTIVGDQAQSSWPYPEEAEKARNAALDGKPIHRFRLSTNYRNSAEVYDLAARVAAKTMANPDLADAVRRTGQEPEHLVVPEVSDSLRTAVESQLAELSGTIAVVAPRDRLAEVSHILAEQLAAHDRLRVLDGLDTKGLEFDGVIVVEPDHIVAESESGWRTLYVVLTRATTRLTTLATTAAWLEAID